MNNNTGGFKMSRTYRRKTTNRINWACDLEHYISEHIRVEGTYKYVSVYYATDSKEYKKGLARYHTDGATNRFKEPGPSFFRNLFSDRPLRRTARRPCSPAPCRQASCTASVRLRCAARHPRSTTRTRPDTDG